MIIHKVIFAGLLASFSLAQANPVALKRAEPNPIESVANIVTPIGKELVGLTSLPEKQAVKQVTNDMVVSTANAIAAPVVTSAGMARSVHIEVDAPAAAPAPAKPIKENDINMFLLAALMVGAIMLRRRAE